MWSLKINSAGISETGTNKQVNQDSFFYKIVDTGFEYAGLLAVADGVGGLKDGEVASAIAISNLNKWWNNDFKTYYSDSGKLISTLIACFKKSNNDIIEYSKQKNISAATTLSVLLIHKNTYHVIHIGDSRIYKITRRIEKLTLDHTCLIDIIIDGKVYKKSVLTECLGNNEDVNYYYTSGNISKNDIFMVCSDGIYKTISDIDILKLARRSKFNLDLACRNMIYEAKTRGEKDDITLILARITK